MCSTSQNMPNGLNAQAGQSQGQVAGVAVQLLQVQRYRREGTPDEYVLIDIREQEEDRSDCLKEFKDVRNIPLGKLLYMAKLGQLDDLKSKKIVFGCNSGFRSGIAAREIQAFGFKEVYSVDGGFSSWTNLAKSSPEFVAILSSSTDVERITLALASTNAAATNGLTCALILMGSAVKLVQKQKNDDEKQIMEGINQGEPFKPVKDMMETFVKKHHGYVFCCKSCVANLGLQYSDLFEYVSPIQAPDVVRMQMQSKSNLQFM